MSGTRTKSLSFSDREELTAEKLREQLAYDPDTGAFTWLVSRKGVKKGEPAGAISNGRLVVTVGGHRYLAARLAWLYVHGELPGADKQIRYKDADPSNNRIDNLRLAWTPREHYDNFKERHPTLNRLYILKKLYSGMTEADYMALYVAQDAVCAVCRRAETVTRAGKVRWLCVDHCHKTGDVRGLLCSGCDTAIGYAQDEPERLDRAAAYLRAHQARKAH